MARVVRKDVFQALQAIMDGFWNNDTNPYIDKNIQKKVEQVKAEETPNVIKDNERKVTYSSKTIPEEGRVVVKHIVNESQAIEIAHEKAVEKAKQKENSHKDRDIE